MKNITNNAQVNVQPNLQANAQLSDDALNQVAGGQASTAEAKGFFKFKKKKFFHHHY